jgi:methionyl-tRNA formyltransferase
LGALNILLASSDKVAIPICDYLIQNHGLKQVITGPDKPTGRGRNLTPNDFSAYCSVRGLEVFKPTNDSELDALLEAIKPDLVVTAAYGRLIKKHQLSMPNNGWLNIHFSLLPRWRGAAPVQFTILNGDELSGVTVFKLDIGLDTGPVYDSVEYRLTGNETSEELLDILSRLAVKPLEESLRKIEHEFEPTPQSEQKVTLAPKLSKADGQIDWSTDAASLERKVRALSPWPGAWSRLNGKQITIAKAEVSRTPRENNSDNGTLNLGPEIAVQCGEGLLILKRVKPEGKKEMSADEWVRGIQNREHLRFETV